MQSLQYRELYKVPPVLSRSLLSLLIWSVRVCKSFSNISASKISYIGFLFHKYCLVYQSFCSCFSFFCARLCSWFCSFLFRKLFLLAFELIYLSWFLAKNLIFLLKQIQCFKFYFFYCFQVYSIEFYSASIEFLWPNVTHLIRAFARAHGSTWFTSLICIKNNTRHFCFWKLLSWALEWRKWKNKSIKLNS